MRQILNCHYHDPFVIRLGASTTCCWIACTKTPRLGGPWSCTVQDTTRATDTTRACKWLHSITNNSTLTLLPCQTTSRLRQMCKWLSWLSRISRWRCINNNIWRRRWCQRRRCIRARAWNRSILILNRREATSILLVTPSIFHSLQRRHMGKIIRLIIIIIHWSNSFILLLLYSLRPCLLLLIRRYTYTIIWFRAESNEISKIISSRRWSLYYYVILLI